MSTLRRTAIGTCGLLVLALPSALAVTQPDGTAEPIATQQTPATPEGRVPPELYEQQRCRARPIPFSRIVIVEGPTTPAEQRQCLVILRTRAEAQSSGDNLERLRRR
jgi:hypothetical protein